MGGIFLGWKEEVFAKLNLIQEALNDLRTDIAYIKNQISLNSSKSSGKLESDLSNLINFLKLELSEVKFLINRVISLQLEEKIRENKAKYT